MHQDEWQIINPLVKRKIFPPGNNIMSMLVELKTGGIGPEHAHPHEQLGYVISGRIQMVLSGKEIELGAGEQVWIPGNAVHSVLALEDSLLLETFTPLRDDLLATTSYVRKAESES